MAEQNSGQSQRTSIPPAEPPTAPPANQLAVPPQQVGASDLPATKAGEVDAGLAGPPVQGGVSWEEVRKGQPPRVVKNPDQRIWSDRFTSELQMVNMTDGRWKPVRPLFVPE